MRGGVKHTVSVLICLILSGLGWVQAQPDTALDLSVGVHGEYGFTRLSVKPYAPTRGGRRIGGGVSVRLDNSKIFGMNAELNYTLTEYRVVEESPRPFNGEGFTPGEQSCRQTWLELPLIAEIGYRFPVWRVYVLGGCYGDFLLRERFGPGGALRKQAILHSTHNRLGGGLVGGAGVGVVTKFGAFIFEYRAAMRLVSLYKRDYTQGVPPSETLTSHSFGLNYYYTFTIRKTERAK